MAKSARQQKIDRLKKDFFEALEAQVQLYVDDETDFVDDSWIDWEDIVQFCRDNSAVIAEVCGASHKDYEGKLTVTPVDRRKILDEVEGSCLSEKAKDSFKKLLEE